MAVVHHPELHVETDVPEEHVPILCGDEGNAGSGWVEGPAPESWARDDFGNVIPVETEPVDAETESAKLKSTTKPTKTDKKDAD